MHKVGMYGGSFNPLHMGHVNNIIEASTMCEKLYVVLSYSHNRKEIDHKIRFKWLKQLTKEMDSVEIIEVIDEDNNKNNYNWEKGRDDIVEKIKEKIDIIFCGDDYKNTNKFETLYPDSTIHYFSRNTIKISSTEIRKSPLKYFDFLPNIVKPYYVKKIVIIGTESCGKSTLVHNLAKIYNTNHVKEVGRDICDNAGGIDNMSPNDFIEILLKHKLRELEAVKLSNKILFIDTEAMITLYYLKLLYGEKENIINIFELGKSLSKLNSEYYYIFLEPDVKWIQDGTRTYGEEEIRKKNNIILKEMLKEQNIKYEVINGDYHSRYEKAKKIINKILGNK